MEGGEGNKWKKARKIMRRRGRKEGGVVEGNMGKEKREIRGRREGSKGKEGGK